MRTFVKKKTLQNSYIINLIKQLKLETSNIIIFLGNRFYHKQNFVRTQTKNKFNYRLKVFDASLIFQVFSTAVGTGHKTLIPEMEY